MVETVKMDQPDENPNLEMNLSETKILQYCAVNGVEESNCPSPDMHISARRCSSGSTGYSTCSSGIHSVRQADKESHEEVCRENLETEDEPEQDDKEEENSNDDLDSLGNESDRCPSAGLKWSSKKSFQNLERGLNGYHSIESKHKLLTPISLGDAITGVIQVIEGNIKDLKFNHENTVNQLRTEQEVRFTSFSKDQEENIRKISKNIAETELETRRIKEEAEENIKSLKASIHEIHYENSSKAESSNIELVQRNNELKEITTMHDKYIQGMTSNLDKISLENRDAVSNLLDNLEMAKQENYAIIEKQNKAIEELRKCQEAAFEDFKRELEKVKDLNEMVQSDAKDREDARLENSNQITTKLEIQDNAIKRLEERLESVSHNAVEKHNSMNKTHSQSMSDLREEFISQMIVNKEVSITVQEEFNEKLEEINQSLSKKTASNQAKIQEIKEVLDGISVNIEQKLESTAAQLKQQLNETTLQGNGESTLDLDIKDTVNQLSKRVSAINEKMYEFEQTKRNNLLFYGLVEQQTETNEDLAKQISQILTDKIGFQRDIFLTSVSRVETGPGVGGARPVSVTFQSYKDREAVLRRSAVLKNSNIHITEDLSKAVRESRLHLNRFMRQAKRINPQATCFLQYDKLFVDNRIYVWDSKLEEVMEKTSEGNIPVADSVISSASTRSSSRPFIKPLSSSRSTSAENVQCTVLPALVLQGKKKRPWEDGISKPFRL